MADITNHVFGLNDVYDRVKRSVWPVWVDVVPDAFTFTDQTAVVPSSTITSNTITVAGLGAGASSPISITGGTYSKNAGAYTSTAGTVVNGDTISVRHTSSSSGTTAVNTVLNIGGITDTFTSTTAALDTVPNAFTFTSATGVTPSTLTTSNTITISGINTATPISISGGSYSINSGAYTTASGTINNGATLTVQHTSSASVGVNTVTTVTIGGVNGTFTSTTRAADTTPDSFSFSSVTGAEPGLYNASSEITVAGLDAGVSVPVTVTNAYQYYKNGVNMGTAASTAVNGDKFYLSAQASSSFNTTVITTLTIGGVNGTFSVTTRVANSTPTSLGTFTALTNQVPESAYQSNTITVGGLEVTATGYRNGSGSVYQNGSQMPFGSTVSVNNGDTFYCGATGGTDWGSSFAANLYIGGAQRTWNVSMRALPADALCNDVDFTSVTNAVGGSTYTSNTVTISGMTSGVSVPIKISATGTSNFSYSKNGGAYITADGTVTNGDTITVRLGAPATAASSSVATIRIGVSSTGYMVATYTVTRP